MIKKYEKDILDAELKTKYKFIVKTGSGTNAGTNADVMFKLFGDAGTWEQTELKPKNSTGIKFPTNSIVEIELNGPILGELNKLKIWVNIINFSLKYDFFSTAFILNPKKITSIFFLKVLFLIKKELYRVCIN